MQITVIRHVNGQTGWPRDRPRQAKQIAEFLLEKRGAQVDVLLPGAVPSRVKTDVKRIPAYARHDLFYALEHHRLNLICDVSFSLSLTRAIIQVLHRRFQPVGGHAGEK